MDQPENLAFDAEGRVFVADQINRRIDVFDADGTFLFAFGKEVNPHGGDLCTPLTGCKQGGDSTEGGGFSRPDGLGISGSTVYVADDYNNRIAVYDTSGTFRYVFGADVNSNGEDVCSAGESCRGGLSGPEAGEISGPYDVKVEPSGLLAITENGNDRLAFFTPQGGFVRAVGKGVDVETSGDDCSVTSGCQAGDPGGAVGSMSGPTALSIDATGDVFVADTNNNRIDEWSPGGGFVKAWGAGVVDGSETFQVCSSETGCVAGLSEKDFPGAVPNPYGVAVDCQGGIWTAEAASAISRVQRFGEAGTPNPPCQASAPITSSVNLSEPAKSQPPAAPPASSNVIKFGKLKLNKKKGTATLTVKVPDPGKLVIAGKGLKKATKMAKKAGSVVLPVKPVGKAKAKLAEVGKLKLKAKVTFTPTGGTAASKSRSLTLKKTLG